MSFEHLLSLVNHVPLAALDALSRDVWRGAGEGALTEAQAQALAEAIHGRRKPRIQTSAVSLGCLTVVSSQRPPEAAAEALGAPSGQDRSKDPRLWSYFPIKRSQRSPDRARSLERRRTLAASGPLPPKLACRFTTGELAVLKVVADAFVASGQCTLSIPEIAARSGVSQTTARGALRIAQNLGLVSITERRVPYRPNLTNVVRVVSPVWLTWLEGRKPRSKVPEGTGGAPPTPRQASGTAAAPPGRGEGSLLRGPRNQGFTRKEASGRTTWR
ncbi:MULTISPECIES: hypothetical protein [Methylobacterium]|uniref:hypothetical protein n=1 Tax=Methylobacterium TaxID=407 RepID=UPI000ABF27DD|nr:MULTISPECIES: hypothetical protein [Methylobacterium]MCI9882924.1 hypothetical protein [Methylobacterium goesingense]